MSFLKYEAEMKQAAPSEKPVSFSRAHIDGMPFRGQPVPLREEEFDEFTEVVCDAGARLFDLSNPEDVEDYRKVIEKIINQAAICVREHFEWARNPDGSKTPKCFLVWAEPFKEINRSRASHQLSHNLIGSNSGGDGRLI
jgi:uncharacterized protein YaaR (DUF327 family)